MDEYYNLPGQISVEDLEGVMPEKAVDAAVEKVEAEIVTDPRKEEIKELVRELSDSVNEERYSETISIAHAIASKVAQILVIERNKEDSNY